MISSMTAFAREDYQGDLGAMSWELRSVNHRYLEVVLRLPEELRTLEPMIRETIKDRLGRGKVDCNLKVRSGAGAEVDLRLNQSMINQLLSAEQELAEMLQSDSDISPFELLRWPGVLEESELDYTPIKQQVMELLATALDTLVDNRLREGGQLAEIVAQRCRSMQELVVQVRGLMPKVIQGVRERIQERLQEVMQELDESRLEQEMALISQRLDVDEEMDRLDTHLLEVERVLQSDEPVGRRLDFLMQELNREVNTLSSKSNDVEVTGIAVEMKVLIEQMREQIQNIE